MKFTFSDEVLAALAQSVQLGMLTGTDVVDHIRLLEVEPDPSDVTPSIGQDTQLLTLTSDCKVRLERNIADLLTRATEISKQMQALDDGKAGST